MKSSLEETFAFQVKAYGLPTPVREYKFHPERRFRFDFCWPEYKVACEIHGGIFINGGHNRPTVFQSDMEKRNLANQALWSLYEFGPKQIKDGSAVQWMAGILAGKVKPKKS